MNPSAAHVLLIDDDPCIHDAVRMILEPEGYRVTACRTGPEGLAAAEANPPDVVLLDIMLTTPTEGFHLAYQMRKQECLHDVPIIVLSAIGQTMGISISKEAGSEYLPVERFIEKPFDAATLRGAVQAALRTCGEAT